MREGLRVRCSQISPRECRSDQVLERLALTEHSRGPSLLKFPNARGCSRRNLRPVTLCPEIGVVGGGQSPVKNYYRTSFG